MTLSKHLKYRILKMTKNISLKYLLKKYWIKIIPTWLLVLGEGLLVISLPIMIGEAVDELLKKNNKGLFYLGCICLALLIVGSLRRFYDTRIYSKIYVEISTSIVRDECRKDSNNSEMIARVNLFSEFIEFLEQSIPVIIQQFITLAGTLVILFFISSKVFLSCLGVIVFTFIVYILFEKNFFLFTTMQNNEFEKRVSIINNRKYDSVSNHFSRFAGWQIKLSDLETINYIFIWLGLSIVILFTVYVVSHTDGASFGRTVSSIMYVFNFVECLLSFPIYYQQLIRLRDIASRITLTETSALLMTNK